MRRATDLSKWFCCPHDVTEYPENGEQDEVSASISLHAKYPDLYEGKWKGTDFSEGTWDQQPAWNSLEKSGQRVGSAPLFPAVN